MSWLSLGRGPPGLDSHHPYLPGQRRPLPEGHHQHMVTQKPLDAYQRELVNLVKAAHTTVDVARRTSSTELSRRIRENRIRIEREHDESETQIKIDMDAEMVLHQSNLDEALIAAYEANVPIRQIALDGFGNQYTGGAQQRISKLRDDGRIGSKTGYQRNTGDSEPASSYPKPVDVASILAEATTMQAPTFKLMEQELVVIAATPTEEAITVSSYARLTMDERDPWFRSILGDAAPGATLGATTATLFWNPYNATEMRVLGSTEKIGKKWHDPVAYWVALHPVEAFIGFKSAFATAE